MCLFDFYTCVINDEWGRRTDNGADEDIIAFS